MVINFIKSLQLTIILNYIYNIHFLSFHILFQIDSFILKFEFNV